MRLHILGLAFAALTLGATGASASPATARLTDISQAPPVTAASDPADSLYRAAREALGDGNYERAAQLFHDVGVRYPKSALVPDAMYYEAFAQYRSGGAAAMRSARDVLSSLRQRYPRSGHLSDAATLSTRICGTLAQEGDASCAAEIAAQASSTAVGGTAARSAVAGCDSSGKDDERVAALNALLQMDAARAEPILDRVLARRDACSAPLRRKAVFLVAQKESSHAADVLLHVAQTDPDSRVREQAVFWLSQVHDAHATSILADLLRRSSDLELRKRALFALGQSGSPTSTAIIREYAADAAQPSTLRSTAIFWLGQEKGRADNVQFLKDLYSRLTDERLKERVLFSLSQGDSPGRAAWLVQLAQRPTESIAARKQAIFLAGQAGVSVAQLASLYDSTPPGALREQLIFVLAQRRDPAALDKLISIARSDKDPESRKKALFWLGQSHDPRALAAINEVIDR